MYSFSSPTSDRMHVPWAPPEQNVINSRFLHEIARKSGLSYADARKLWAESPRSTFLCGGRTETGSLANAGPTRAELEKPRQDWIRPGAVIIELPESF